LIKLIAQLLAKILESDDHMVYSFFIGVVPVSASIGLVLVFEKLDCLSHWRYLIIREACLTLYYLLHYLGDLFRIWEALLIAGK
jgi:hypothetical protein